MADIVQGVTITSSPGRIPVAPTQHINPEVHELTTIACFTLKKFCKFFSNNLTYLPPKKFYFHKLKYFFDFNTLFTILISLWSIIRFIDYIKT